MFTMMDLPFVLLWCGAPRCDSIVLTVLTRPDTSVLFENVAGDRHRVRETLSLNAVRPGHLYR